MPAKSVSGPKAMHARYSNVSPHAGPVVTSFMDADSDNLKRVIEGVTLEGDAITFSRTRDGGAMSVAVISEGTPYKWYPADSVELNEVLDGLLRVSEAVRQ